uniref:Uncharacterized protein n=1 Tax=Romanomermis culicivorax TaxID=13658 RepID=A0A915L0J5_ROMCU
MKDVVKGDTAMRTAGATTQRKMSISAKTHSSRWQNMQSSSNKNIDFSRVVIIVVNANEEKSTKIYLYSKSLIRSGKTNTNFQYIFGHLKDRKITHMYDPLTSVG